MTLRRLAAAAVTTAVVLTPTLGVTSAPAGAADTGVSAKGCVTKAEFKKVRKGMSQAQVHRIFGTAGKQTSRTDAGPGGIITGRAYQTCTKNGGVGVSYVAKNGQGPKLAEKAASWR